VTDTEGKVLFPQLGLAGGGIAVTCTTDEGEIVETIVDAELEHCVLEDPITLSEVLLPALVEAQFESRGEGSDLLLAVLPFTDWAAPMRDSSVQPEWKFLPRKPLKHQPC
jgi:hypothetical protein